MQTRCIHITLTDNINKHPITVYVTGHAVWTKEEWKRAALNKIINMSKQYKLA